MHRNSQINELITQYNIYSESVLLTVALLMLEPALEIKKSPSAILIIAVGVNV